MVQKQVLIDTDCAMADHTASSCCSGSASCEAGNSAATSLEHADPLIP